MVTTAYPNLAEHLRSWGLKVHEVNGWRTRSARTTTFTPRAVIAHHTAGAATGNAPSLNYIVQNNLSQFVLGRDGTVYLCSGNRQNHAGYGGPLRGVPKDSGNRYCWGIEAENTGRGEAWPAVQLEAYYTLAAALCALHKVGHESVFAHKEWAPSRKVDPAGINMDDFRRKVAARLYAGQGDPVLSLGDTGSKVEDVQRALNKHGFTCTVDGDFGPNTEKAVKAFQAARGMAADGIVGAKTWAALRETAPVQPAPTPAPTLKTGGNRMLVQFRGDNHVWEVVGSELVHVTATAWKARGLSFSNVNILDPSHPLNELPKKKATS